VHVTNAFSHPGNYTGLFKKHLHLSDRFAF
jgi:hypothetical protein